MNWKSNARLGTDISKGSIFDLKGYKISVSIHKYAGCGDELYLTCKELGFSLYNLDTTDFNKAVQKAKELLLARAAMFYKSALEFSKDDSEYEFTRY